MRFPSVRSQTLRQEARLWRRVQEVLDLLLEPLRPMNVPGPSQTTEVRTAPTNGSAWAAGAFSL